MRFLRAAAPAAHARSRSAASLFGAPARCWRRTCGRSPRTNWRPTPPIWNSSKSGIRVAGTDRSLSLAELASRAKDDPRLAVVEEVRQDEATYPNGTHICEVEIDPETGKTVIVNYVVTDDFGVAVNPLLLEGQVMGGIAQGIGQALLEAAVYSEEGQLITASFMDYAMPRADNIPAIDFSMRNVPSTTNALGIKGAGEAGSIGATPAVLNAVVDALHRAYGVTHVEMPATPLRVWQTIEAARG